MKKIKKGDVAKHNGVILTEKEYEEFIKLKNIISEFRSYKKDYNMTYKGYMM